MDTQLDLAPAARRMAALVSDVPEDSLDRPTPCERYRVGDLLDHIAGVVQAFTAAAIKRPLAGGPSGDVANLAPEWRIRIPRDLDALARAWRRADAWEGMTAAGGVDLPAEVAGVVALDELVIHGWDLARAIGQSGEYDGPELEAVFAMAQHFAGSGVDGLFGPPVDVEPGAPLLHRILGLSGRDPRWRPPPA